jgi:biotin transport system substrate-specific component
MNHAPSGVLIDRWTPARSAGRDVLYVVSFALLTAILAQVRIPLPNSPVPITGQTLAVLLAGAVLGARRGSASQTTYLALGGLGMPVFAGGAAGFPHLFGPTGGYLWSFPVAAGLLGWLVERGAGYSIWKLALALLFSDLLILASGTAWLVVFFQAPVNIVLHWGTYPFIASNALKIALVGLTIPRLLNRHSDPERS